MGKWGKLTILILILIVGSYSSLASNHCDTFKFGGDVRLNLILYFDSGTGESLEIKTPSGKSYFSFPPWAENLGKRVGMSDERKVEAKLDKIEVCWDGEEPDPDVTLMYIGGYKEALYFSGDSFPLQKEYSPLEQFPYPAVGGVVGTSYNSSFFVFLVLAFLLGLVFGKKF